MKYTKSRDMDEKCYEFHEGDSEGRCFLCGAGSCRLFIMDPVFQTAP
jgi:hypothetical protein